MVSYTEVFKPDTHHKAGYDKLKGKLSVGASYLGFTLGELDSKVNRGALADKALNGSFFGVAYGLATGADIPVSKGKASVNVNVGGGLSTPSITYFDFSNSKLIGNTKDKEPYAIGLMHSFGGL